MLYSEFAEGTGCRDTEHNHGVYERVEKMYMNDENMTKEEAYKIAALWIDNSLTEEQEEQNKLTNEQIKNLQEDIEFYTNCLEDTKQKIKELKEQIKDLKASAAYYKDNITDYKNEIERLQTCIIK